MTRKYVLPLAACLLLLGFKSPNTDISWGTQEKAGSSNASYIPLGWIGGHYYAVQLDGHDGLLMNINDKMDIESQKALESGQKKFDADIMFMRKGKICMMSSDYESGEKTDYVRATSFDLDAKPSDIKYRKVATVNVNKSGEKQDFQYFFSADSSTLLILMVHDMSKSDNAKVSLSVVSTDNFTTSWENTAELPYASDDVTLLSAAIGKNGNILLLTSVKGDEGKHMQRYSNHVFSFVPGQDKYSESTVKLEDKFISSAQLRFSSQDQAFVTGFYNSLKSNGRNTGIEGAFVATFEPSDPADLDMHTETVDDAVKNTITPTGFFAKLVGADEMNSYFIHDIYMDADGGYVIAEQRYMVQSENGRTMERSYYFNSILMFRFDADHNIEWISGIPKIQVSSIATPIIGIGPIAFWYFSGAQIRAAYKYNSFTSLEKNGEIYILYNDNKDNGDAKTLDDVKTMSNKNKALASLVEVDPNGQWTKSPLFRGKDLDVILETSSSFSMMENGFTISAERGKNLQYGLLVL